MMQKSEDSKIDVNLKDISEEEKTPRQRRGVFSRTIRRWQLLDATWVPASRAFESSKVTLRTLRVRGI
jgi:hypothetical protein